MSKLISIPNVEGQDALWINPEHVVAVRQHVFTDEDPQEVEEGEEPAKGEFVIALAQVSGEDAVMVTSYYSDDQRDGILRALGLSA